MRATREESRHKRELEEKSQDMDFALSTNFYAGHCERCGCASHDRDCYFNSSTGEEMLLCPDCGDSIND